MKMTKLRWWIIGLVCVGTIVNYLSRSSLSVAAPAMMKELHFDEQQYSWVVSAFQLCYTIAQPITGYLMDVIGLKIGFFIFALLWSLINMAHALAGGWISLAFLRGLMGLTEASAIPAGIKASAEWFPTKERGIAGGLFNIGTSIGAMLAPPLVVWAMLTFADSGIGTEMAFVITGGIGVLFAITWFLIYNSPNKHRGSPTKSCVISKTARKAISRTITKNRPLKRSLKSVISGRWRLPVFWLTRHGER